jgi:hypothetical protein
MHELYCRARQTRDPDDINDFCAAVTEFVTVEVRMRLAKRNLRFTGALVDDVATDITAVVGRKIDRLLRTNIHNIAGYVVGIIRHEIANVVDRHLRVCGLGVCAKTRKRRIKRGQEPNRPDEYHRRTLYRGQDGEVIDLPDEWVQDRLPAVFSADYREGLDPEYWEFLGAVKELAWAHVGPDPRLRKALGLIEAARDEPIISEVGRLVGMRRQTLVDQLRRLGDRIVVAAPAWVHEAGQKYWRQAWPSTVKSATASLSSYRGEEAA